LVPGQASAAPLAGPGVNLEAVATGPAIEKITYIGSSLGTSEVTNDGQGNFVADRYTDARATYLSPEFALTDVPAAATVELRTTWGDSAKRVTLTQNRFGLWEQRGSSDFSRPGERRLSVRFDVLVDRRSIGALTVNFAPAAEQPVGFDPNAVEGQLAAPQNVRVDSGRLTWDAVPGAERYQITALLIDGGRAVDLWKVDSDNLTGTSESVAEIADFLDLPAGDYRFEIKASTLHNGFWNGSVASPYSARTEIVAIG
jgi:hypothetical protein